jgi:hypothetical protein
MPPVTKRIRAPTPAECQRRSRSASPPPRHHRRLDVEYELLVDTNPPTSRHSAAAASSGLRALADQVDAMAAAGLDYDCDERDGGQFLRFTTFDPELAQQFGMNVSIWQEGGDDEHSQ